MGGIEIPEPATSYNPQRVEQSMNELEPISDELLLAEVRRHLPDPLQEERFDGFLKIVAGDPEEAVVRISDSKVSIAEFAMCWEGPHTCVPRPRPVATFNWKRLPASCTMTLLRSLIESVCEMRRAKYGTCEKCGETKPPEWMHNQNICYPCASKHRGIVY